MILEYENTTDREDKFFTLACLYLTRDWLTSIRECQLPADNFWHHYWNAGIEHPLDQLEGVGGGDKKQNPRWTCWHPKGTTTKYSMSIWKLIVFEKPKSSREILSLNKLLWHDARKRLPHNHPLLARVTEHLGRSVHWKWSQRQQNWSWSSRMRSPINSPCWVDSLLGNICYHKRDSKI